MKNRVKSAFVLYMVNSFLAIIFGLRYLLCDTIMPYHEQAIGMKWTELEPNLQVLLNGFIKVVAAGFFILGLTSIVLLIIPFRKGERWAKWLIPALGLTWLGFGLYVAINIAINTQASTPWPVGIIVLATTVVAFFLSGALLNSENQ